MNQDLTPDLYEIFDRCGLTASNILTAKQPTPRTVSEIRVKLAREVNALLQQQLERKEGDDE